MSQRSTPKTKVLAVLTGDIVGSTGLSRGDMAGVRTAISDAVHGFTRRNDSIAKGAEFFQGDSWQVLLGDPVYALRLALLVQAGLRSKTNAETRTAIGIGTVEGLEKTAAISTGEAFTLSGRALTNMKSAYRLTGALPERAGPLAQWFPCVLHLCSALMQGWTRRQAEVMGLWLSAADPTYDWIASRLKPPIAKQSVGDILTSANLPELYEALAMFQKTDWQRVAGPEAERAA
jgi:hypothetical protein